LVGILHADCPVRDWKGLAPALASETVRDCIIWSRARLESGNTSGVLNVHAVIVGHTPIKTPIVLGNVVHIDTGGWLAQGCFTLLDLNGLKRCTCRPVSTESPRWPLPFPCLP